MTEEYRTRKFIEEARKANADLSYTMGMYFGYPHCCVSEYCTDVVNGDSPDRNVDGSGFIPCTEHFGRIQLGETELKDLIKNRVCKEAFPTENS